MTETSSVKPGTCLGPCEIVSLLGAGGIGEVYRARDCRLKRDVAVKDQALATCACRRGSLRWRLR